MVDWETWHGDFRQQIERADRKGRSLDALGLEPDSRTAYFPLRPGATAVEMQAEVERCSVKLVVDEETMWSKESFEFRKILLLEHIRLADVGHAVRLAPSPMGDVEPLVIQLRGPDDGEAPMSALGLEGEGEGIGPPCATRVSLATCTRSASIAAGLGLPGPRSPAHNDGPPTHRLPSHNAGLMPPRPWHAVGLPALDRPSR